MLNNHLQSLNQKVTAKPVTFWLIPTLFASVSMLVACEKPSQSTQQNASSQQESAAESWQWQLPPGFEQPFVPPTNPMSEAKFQLGRALFYDVRLSGNGTQSCASCHFQHLAFTDGLATSVGSTGESGARSAMSIVNSAYYPTLTWANPSLTSLERQALVPMFVDNVGVELGINDENKEAVLARFRNDTQYQKMYKQAFPQATHPINFDTIIKALATFERGIISGNSKYDQAQQGRITLSESEARGQKLFFGQAQCAQCHSGFNFSDQTFHANTSQVKMPFHNTGLYNVDGKGSYPSNNPGLIGVMPGEQNTGKFRVPSLRNIALTAPYMHDGSIKDLETVVKTYAAHGRVIESGTNKGDGRSSPYKDPIIDKIALNSEQQKDLVAFLHTLTDHDLITNPRFSDPSKKSD